VAAGGAAADEEGMIDAAAISQAELASRVSVAVAKKAQDVSKDTGEAMISLLEGAVKLAREASRGAVSAAASVAETGQNLDATA